MPAFIDGFGLGIATKVAHAPNPGAASISSFFGIHGVQFMYGGSRGRTFQIESLWVDTTPAAIVADEYLLENFADGNTHIFVDTTGTSWFNVVYLNEYQRASDHYMAIQLPTDPPTWGWCMPFRMILHGLA